MIILKVREEEKKYFEDFDPYGLLNRLELPYYFALAAVSDDSDGNSHPIGLLVASVKKERVIIEWIYVSFRHRKQGIGRELLNYVIDKSKGCVSAHLLFHDTMFMTPDNVDLFLEKCGFTGDKMLCGEWNVGIKEIISSPIILKYSNKVKARTLKSLDTPTRNYAVAKLYGEEGDESPFEIREVGKRYDPDISTVVIENDKYPGMLLASKIGNVVYPFFFFAHRKNDALGLFVSATTALINTIGTKTRVCVRTTDIAGYVMASSILGKGDSYTEIRSYIYADPSGKGNDSLNEVGNITYPLSKFADKIQNLKRSPYVHSLTEISQEDYNEFLIECVLDLRDRISSEVLLYDKSAFIGDASCCRIVDGEIEGIILTKRDLDYSFKPVLIYSRSNSKKSINEMLIYNLKNMVDNYPNDTCVSVTNSLL